MTRGLTIYFAGAISGGRADVSHYRTIVQALEEAGHYVLAGAVASEEVSAHGENIDAGAIWTRDLSWIEEADVLVAEVSLPSTGVGYEVATARYRYGKPVVCLYRAGHTKRCSAMIAGDSGVELIGYQETPEMLVRLRAALAKYTAAAGG
jgi:2'-deoxynucleoside 5'-phosphate N-hydrolase